MCDKVDWRISDCLQTSVKTGTVSLEPEKINNYQLFQKEFSITDDTAPHIYSTYRRKIRLIEGNAKCRHLKKLTVQGLCGRCLSVSGP
jgi:hypothetical protein